MRKSLLLYTQVAIRRFGNPIFFMLLALSFLLWYITKLSYTYTSEINVPLRIDTTYYTVRCHVEGVGYQLQLNKWAPRKNSIVLSSDNIAVTPSPRIAGGYEISEQSLQNIIAAKVSDLKILSVGEPIRVERSKR